MIRSVLVDRADVSDALAVIDSELLRCQGLPDHAPWIVRLRSLRTRFQAAAGILYVHQSERAAVQRGELSEDEATVRVTAPPPQPPSNLSVREDQELVRPGHTRQDALACGKLVGGPWLVLVLVLALVLWLVAIGVALWPL